MASKAASAPSTRLHPPLAGHVRPRRRARHGTPRRQPTRQRACPGDDATAAACPLRRRPQAHTALCPHRQHAGLGRRIPWRRWHGVAQGDGSDDDAGKQLPVRVWVPHLVPRHRVPTRTIAHASFPDTGCNTLTLTRTSSLRCCCCCRGGGGERGPAQVSLARSSPRAATRSVVEDALPFLYVPPACLCPHPATDVS